MAIPVLKLNLAPPPTLWRRQHVLLSWTALALGSLALLSAIGLTWNAYHQASQMGLGASQLSRKSQTALASQGSILAQLRSINVQKELPRWKLAERILGERSNPWSRLTAELERSLVQDVRIRTLQRTRGTDQQVAAKIKGEANSREAEAAFVESIQKNGFFSQVVLERESERQGGGIEFEFTLPVSATPPPYTPLPKYGPATKAAKTGARPQAMPQRSQAPAARPQVTAPKPQAPSSKPAPRIQPPARPSIAVPSGAVPPGTGPDRQGPRERRNPPGNPAEAGHSGTPERPRREVKR